MKVIQFFPLALPTILILLLPGNLFLSNSVRTVSSQGPNPRISTRLARTICGQSSEFSRTKVIQPPAKSPGSGLVGLPCGWIDWTLGPSHPDTYKTCSQMEGSSSSSSTMQGSNNGRIHGGQEATPHQFPYMTYSVIYKNGIRYPWCGGAILNEEWVISAAHCNDQITEVVAGDHLRSTEDGTEQVRKISRVLERPGPRFENDLQSHDIYLIKVYPPFVFNEYVQPIALPPRDLVPQGIVTISGWGHTQRFNENPNRTLPDALQWTPVAVLPNPKCQEYLEKWPPYDPKISPPVDETVVCTGYEDARSNACNGDSGSPVVSTYDGKTVLVGIVSSGIAGGNCTWPDRPAFHKRVSYGYYLDYIAKGMAEN